MGKEYRIKIVEDFIQLLVNSGHKFTYIKSVILQGVTKFVYMLYRNNLNSSDKVHSPLHRLRTYKQDERKLIKYTNGATWFTDTDFKDKYRNRWKMWIRRRGDLHKKWKRRGKDLHSRKPVTAVFFIPKTPGGKLLDMVQKGEQKLENQLDWRVKLLEKPGTPLFTCFMKKFAMEKGCFRGNDCMCKGKGTNCMTKGVVYEAVCAECKSDDSTYIGETARQVGVRAGEHIKNAELLKMNSFIVEHWMLKHPLCTDQPKFEFKVLSKHNDALSRQVREAVTILDRGKLNKKNEFGINEIIKMEPSRYEWEQEQDRKTIFALENERQACLKSFITVMAAVRNHDAHRIKSLTLTNNDSNFYRKHFNKRKGPEMGDQNVDTCRMSKRTRGPTSSTPIQFRQHRQLDSSSGSSSILTNITDQDLTTISEDGEAKCGSRTELSWETANVVLDKDKEQEPLLDILAKKTVMMDSFSEAEQLYSERKVGVQVRTLLDGVSWEDNVRFKKNDSDEISYEMCDILGDNKDPGSNELVTHDNNVVGTGMSSNSRSVILHQLAEIEDYGLDLLFGMDQSLTDDVENYDLERLFTIDLFNEETFTEEVLERKIISLRKNKLYDIFLQENKLGTPKRKSSPEQETISKLRRMTIAASSPDPNSPVLRRPPRRRQTRTRSETAISSQDIYLQQPRQQLITRFLGEGNKH